MLDVTLLGQGGTLPLPGRYLTALWVEYQGEAVLIDCGEGTQVAIQAAGKAARRIGTLLFTHFHADHVAGLPGLLLTMSNQGRTRPVTLVGPRGLAKVVRGLLVIAPQLGFPLDFVELDGDFVRLTRGDLVVSAQWVKHGIPCYGYRIDLPRRPRFRPEAARQLGVPTAYWSQLQKGKPVLVGSTTIMPHQVLGRPRPGIALCYTTDLRPSREVVQLARDVALFVCEGCYGAAEDQPRALKYGHTMFAEAAQMARDGQVGELWLTHFSPALTAPENYLPLAQKIFPDTHIDKRVKTLVYPPTEED